MWANLSYFIERLYLINKSNDVIYDNDPRKASKPPYVG
jgi:hypothetical protein